MLTATAVCRRASSIKVRISINNLSGSWLFRSRSRCLILTLLICSPDHGYPWILDHCSRWVSREEIDRFAGAKTHGRPTHGRPCPSQRSRPLHLEERCNPWHTRKVSARTSSNSAAHTSGRDSGNNTGTTWGGNHPK